MLDEEEVSKLVSGLPAAPTTGFNVGNLTWEDVDAEIHKTINTLERLTALQAAMLGQDNRRVKRLVEEYQAAKREEEAREVKPGLGPDGTARERKCSG